MIQIDVTGDRFDLVDMDNCHVWFPMPRQLESTLIVEMSNLLLRTSEHECELTGNSEGLGFEANAHNVFVHGVARIVFDRPGSIACDVSLFEQSDPKKGFLHRLDGEVARLQRTQSSATQQPKTEYDLGGRLLWPHGDFDLTVGSDGPVIAEFSVSDCISSNEFSKNPAEWLSKCAIE